MIIERVKPEDKGVYRYDGDGADAATDADGGDEDDDNHFVFTIL